MAEPDHTNPLPSKDNNAKVIFICSVCSNKFSSLHDAQNHPGCWRENVEKPNQGSGIPKKAPVGEDNQLSLDIQEKVSETNQEVQENVAEPSLADQEKIADVAEPSLEGQENVAEPSLEGQENVAEPSLEGQENAAEPSLEGQENVAEPSLEGQEKISEPVQENVTESSMKDQENVSRPSLEGQQKIAEPVQEKVTGPAAPEVAVQSSGSHFCRVCTSEFKSEESLLLHCKTHEQVAAPVDKTQEVAAPVIKTHEEVVAALVKTLEKPTPALKTHEVSAPVVKTPKVPTPVPVVKTHEVAAPATKTHEISAPIIDQTVMDKLSESKELFLKIETDQGEFCVQLDANDIYNLSEQKVALDLDSIRKSTAASSTNNSSPSVATSNTPLTAKLHSVNYKTNYVLDLLQEKLHNTDKIGKSNTPFLVDTDTKVNKPVDKVIDEIIKRNENITTTRKSSDSGALHSDVSKNKPVNQIIDEIIQRNESVTRKSQSKNSYKPRVYPPPPPPPPKQEIDQTVMSLASALPGNIQPGTRLMIGGTTYEILYTSNDEANTPAVTETTESESNMIYIVDDSMQNSMQNTEQSYTLSNMADVAEINTANSFDGTVPIGQITNNQPISQTPVCFVDDIFTVSGDDATNKAKRRLPLMSSASQPCKKAKSEIVTIKTTTEGVRAFVPAPVIEEEDDKLPEKGSMPDDLYDMIMSHLTEPKPMIFKCNLCHRSFRTEGKLKKHVDFEHKDEPPLTCKVCNTSRTYKSKSALATHLQAHEREEEIAKRLKMNENLCHEETSSYICKFTSL